MKFSARGAGWLLPGRGNWTALVLSIASYIFSQVRSSCQAVAPTLSIISRGHPTYTAADEGEAEAKMRASIERLREELNRMRHLPMAATIGTSQSSERERCNLQHLEELVEEEFEYSAARLDPFGAPWYNILEKRIMEVRDMVASLHERERKLELQLMRYCGRKEQQATVMNLESNLKISDMEGRLLGLRVESLEAENRTFRIQLENYEAALEVERSRVRELEGVAGDLRRENGRLMEGNTSLIEELQSTKAPRPHAASASGSSQYHPCCSIQSTPFNTEQGNSSDDDDDDDVTDDADQLKQQKEQLAEEVERLKTDHFSDLEELVYLRWLNACLRHELREHKPPPGTTTARDLNHNLSHTSRDRAKQLVLRYANADANTSTEPTTSTLPTRNPQPKSREPPTASKINSNINGNVSSSKSRASKPKFFGKLKSFVTRKSTTKGNSQRGSVEPPSSRSSSSSSSSSSSARSRHLGGCLSIDCEEPRKVAVKCRSDLGASGKYARMGAVAEENGAASAAETGRSKLSRFAGALMEAGSQGRPFRRSASFTTSGG